MATPLQLCGDWMRIMYCGLVTAYDEHPMFNPIQSDNILSTCSLLNTCRQQIAVRFPILSLFCSSPQIRSTVFRCSAAGGAKALSVAQDV